MRYFLNGALHDVEASSIATGVRPDDRGLTLGDGVFETIAVRNGAARRLDAHFDRLLRGLAILGFARTPTRIDLVHAVDTVIGANDLADGALRLSVTRGAAARGISPQGAGEPTILATASPSVPPSTPVDAVTSETVRRNELSPVSQVKSLSYLDNILARMEAERRGAQEAILLNTRGRVAEATIANIFAVLDGEPTTPPIEEGALPGIARAAILSELPVREAPIPPSRLKVASEVLLTNSMGARAVRSLDGRALPEGGNGGFLERVREVMAGA